MSNITKLRTKVVEIEAMRFTGGRTNAAEIVAWIIHNGGAAIWWPERTHDTSRDTHGREVSTKRKEPRPEHIVIETLEGPMRCEVGDWAFKGMLGEFYPCKDAAKVAKYDEIDDNVINTEEPTA